MLNPQTDYKLIRTPVSDAIKLTIEPLPTATEFCRLTYTAKHTELTATMVLREALINYAVALIAERLVSVYGSDSDSSINADAVQHRSRSQNWSTTAKTCRQRYFDLLRINPTNKPAITGGFAQIETGVMRFTHRR